MKKLCIDCKWHKGAGWWNRPSHLCKHPDALDDVSGEPSGCYNERRDPKACGFEAIRWEPLPREPKGWIE
jgi:hypothetical protein